MGEEKEGKANSVNKSKKSFRLFLMVLFVIVLILAVATVFYFMEKKSSENAQELNQIVLENPMKKIVQESVNKEVPATQETIIQEGVMNFNQDFINYILLALGVGNLHSFVGFGNPVVELNLDGEIWSSEIVDGGLRTIKVANDNKDLVFILSKEEAVKALLSSDIKQFMKDSVVNGKTGIEMTADKPELLAKGYLDLYNNLKA